MFYLTVMTSQHGINKNRLMSGCIQILTTRKHSKMSNNNNKRGVVLHGRAREIICNVDEYFESEKQHNLKLIEQLKTASILSGPNGDITVTREIFALIMQTLQNASKVTERVHLATGINKNTLTRIRREKREAQASCSKVDYDVKSSMVVVAGLPFKCDIGKIVKASLSTIKKEKNGSTKGERKSDDDSDDEGDTVMQR